LRLVNVKHIPPYTWSLVKNKLVATKPLKQKTKAPLKQKTKAFTGSRSTL